MRFAALSLCWSGLLAAVLLAPPAAAAELGPRQVVILLQTNPTVGLKLLADGFRPLQGNPEAISDRAVAMIERLGGDPIAALETATTIADVAGVALHALPVVRLAVDPDYTPPAGGAGWDLGPAGAAARGFEKITETDIRVFGARPRGIVAGGERLIGDGIVGVGRIAVAVADGDYELLLLTGDPEATPQVGPRSARRSRSQATLSLGGVIPVTAHPWEFRPISARLVGLMPAASSGLRSDG
ncbi:MAG: hypothetical protein EXQ94_09900 [Alphaproteobacteria bacterium]|nr:hypothetical protein [Alphaproteobacteria bacterium]